MAALILGGAIPEAVEAALEHPVSWTRERVTAEVQDRHPTQVQFFLRQWQRALPPLERLHAAEQFDDDTVLNGSLAAAVQTFAEELSSFGVFTDGPDAEVDQSILVRLHLFVAQLDRLTSALTPAADHLDRPAPAGDFFRDQMLEQARRGPIEPNDLIALLGAGRLEAAVQLALHHRMNWVELRLDDDAVADHDEAVAAFLPVWLAYLSPLERLQAAGPGSSHFLLALCHLEHASGIGAQLLLEAYAAAASHLATSLRTAAARDSANSLIHPDLGDELLGHAAQLDAMDFASIPLIEDGRAED